MQLFDHLISESLKLGWNRKAKRLRGLQVNDQFVFGRILRWKLGGLGAFEDTVNVGRP
jgi:hypothetical protein